MGKRRSLAIYSPASDLKAGQNDIANVHSTMLDETIGACDKTMSSFFKCRSKREFLNELIDFLSGWDKNDQLIFYYTGHGEMQNDNFHFAFEDHNKNKTILSEATFFAELKTNNVFKAIIIIDSCYSGKLAEGGSKGENVPILQTSQETLPQGFLILTSSAKFEVSNEHKDGSGSIFTDIFTDGLKSGLGGETTKDGLIYADDLVEYVNLKLNDEKYKNFKQKPHFSTYKVSENIWIAKNKSGSTKAENKQLPYQSLPILDVMGHWKNVTDLEQPCENAHIEDLNLGLIKEYLDKQNGELKWELDKIEIILKKLNLLYLYEIDGFYRPKKSAILCFGSFPQNYYEYAISKVILYSDEDKIKKIIDIKGDILTQIESVYELIKENTDFPSFRDGTNYIKEVFSEEDYDTIREIVSNAYAHRDYGIELPITVRIYNNRLEVQNPGLFSPAFGWDYYLKSKKPISKPQNKFIPSFLAYFSKYEGVGQGFQKIRDFLSRHGNNSLVCVDEPSGPFTIIEINHPLQDLYARSRLNKNVVNAQISDSGHVIIGDKAIISIVNLKEAVQYKAIETEIQELNERFAVVKQKSIKYPDDPDFAAELIAIDDKRSERQKDLETLKQEVIKLAENFAHIPINTERLKKAKEFFEIGDFESARIALNEDLVKKELNELLVLKSKKLDDVEENLARISDEYLILARLTSMEFAQEDRFDKSVEYFNQSLNANRNNKNLFAFAYFLQQHNQYIQAVPLYEEALSIYRSLAQSDPQTFLSDVAMTLNNLANLHDIKNELAQAQTEYEEALSIYRSLAQSNPQIFQLYVATTLNNLANLHRSKNELAQAQEEYGEALQIYRTLVKSTPEAFLPDVARTLNNLANLHRSKNELAQAQEEYEEALQIYRTLVKSTPEAFLPDVARTLNNLAVLHRTKNELAQAQGEFEEALQIYRTLAKSNPETFLPDVATALNNLANLHSAKNELEKARVVYEEALQIIRTLAKSNPEAFLLDVANTLNNLAVLYSDKNELEKAQRLYEEALQIRRTLAQSNPEAFLPDVGTTLNNLAVLYSDKNELEKAQVVHEEALQIRRALAKSNPEAFLSDVAHTLNNLANLHSAKNELAKAQVVYEEALQIRRTLAQNNPEAFLLDVAHTLNNLAVLHSAKNELVQAQGEYEEALQIYRDLAQRNPEAFLPFVATTLNNLAVLHRAKNELVQAQGEYEEALQIYRTLAQSNPEAFLSDVANTASNMAVFFQDGQPDRERSLEFVREALRAAMPFESYLKFAQDSIKRAKAVIEDWGLDVKKFLKDLEQ